MSSPRASLRNALREGQNLVLPGAFDVVSALLIEGAGFPAVYLGGSATGAHLGIPEPLLCLIEQLDLAARCAGRLGVPLLVDAHTGFGDATHVSRTVREFERVGVAGIHIEDQVFPKRMHYHWGREYVIPASEFAGKIRAALSARESADFLIVARTDARRAVDGSFAEAVQRGLMLRDLGADVLMPMLDDPVEMREFRRQVPGIPLVTLARPGSPPTAELHALGYQIIIFPSAVLLAAMGAVTALADGLRTTGILALDPGTAADTRRRVGAAMEMDRFLQIEADTPSHTG